jgi:hypothetical protein
LPESIFAPEEVKEVGKRRKTLSHKEPEHIGAESVEAFD